jgi:ribonuclease HI
MTKHVVIQAAGVGPSNSTGIAAAGVVILDGSDLPVVSVNHKLHDLATKRVAEWSAVCLGLRKAHELGATSVVVQIDSDAVVTSLSNGGLRKKQGTTWRYCLIALEYAKRIGDVQYELISPEQNAQAASLADEAVHGRLANQPPVDGAA